LQINSYPDSSDGTTDNHFDTEMLQMNLTGPGVLIRESPTLPSLGRGSIDPGGFYVPSFFDVFVELSLDGGQNWAPQPQPLHLRLQVPDTGSSLALLALALGALSVLPASCRQSLWN
jgi:hypothetical protein